ncbi:MAG: hypothetical protein KGO94_13975 [Alphaproteobacteria bacterium]|nr:hypothetical protein [Alphaproteobacteria bacterium]
MVHYLIELALWVLAAYFIGCLLGYFLRQIIGGAEEVAPAPVKVAAPVAPAPTVTKPAPIAAKATPVVSPAPIATAAPAKMERPKGIEKARGGKADDLQRISGIGPKNEAILHNLGFFHFDQIANWTSEQVAWVDDHLRFGGRIVREEWIHQAGLLAAGKEEEFTRQYGTGGLKNAKGETLSGTRTRKP